MIKRILATIIAIFLFASSIAFACDENQTNFYITQMLFGARAFGRTSDYKVKSLLNGLYLCSLQADGKGQDKLDFLHLQGVGGLPTFSDLNIKGNELFSCAHDSWEREYSSKKLNRKKVLQSTVNTVFDFGLLNKWFGAESGKCNSFAAILYYSHILADYLADDPINTQATIDGKEISAYSGAAATIVNGGVPSFSADQKAITTSFLKYSELDSLGRAGFVFANIGPDILPPPMSRAIIGMIKPSGWNQNRYDGIVNSSPSYLFNRCHLLAHSLGGLDEEINLVTGTRYFNVNGMKPFEDQVLNYVVETGNHVLYRATPIFKGDNKLCSGVQIEAFSVEDKGAGVCFNIYSYNVQPGVTLNYITGNNSISDITFNSDDFLPFITNFPSEQNPDLIYEMIKHFNILFEDQKNSATYTSMINQISSLANEARAVNEFNDNPAQCYLALKKYEYKVFDVLKAYLPLLLQKEEFFSSAFN